VGRHYRQTPVFSSTMTHLVLAPFWHIPPGIARNDLLPRIRENPGHVAAQRMVLFDAATNQPVDPFGVEWSGMTGADFNRRFRLRQDPGPHNALGNVKFMFPNRHSVYLHDTPARELFDRTQRDFSSGCIRVEGALDLAELLLAREGWDRRRIDEAVRLGRERTVRFSTPYRVHLQYWTSWVDEEGILHFRADIYDRDSAVRRAMEAPAPIV
jgi:L,D-transpeptidase YcbB